MTELQIRRATRDDLPAVNGLTRLLQEEHATHYPRMFHRGHMGAYFEKVLAQPTHAVFVAERAMEVIGVAVAELMDELSPNCHPMKLCRLNSIVVAEGARGSGTGRALIAAVEDFGRNGGAQDIRLAVADFNTSAIRLYELLGYEIRLHVMGKYIGEPD